jgi:hypothetical protein
MDCENDLLDCGFEKKTSQGVEKNAHQNSLPVKAESALYC